MQVRIPHVQAPVQRAFATPLPADAPNLLLVSGYKSGAIHVYDLDLGEHLQDIAPVPGAQSIVRGPDGFLYACAEDIHQVLRIDPTSLEILGPFVADDPKTEEDENAGLDGPTAAIFGPDGNLYVASFNTDEILRFDGSNGQFMDVFVEAAAGGLDGPDAGMLFGSDGKLYVPSFYTHQVLRFDGGSGASAGVFVEREPGGLDRPRAILFHGTEVLVASAGNGRINRYDPTGQFLGTLAQVPGPYCLAVHPEVPELFVCSGNSVESLDLETGEPLWTPVAPGSSSLSAATFHFFLNP